MQMMQSTPSTGYGCAASVLASTSRTEIDWYARCAIHLTCVQLNLDIFLSDANLCHPHLFPLSICWHSCIELCEAGPSNKLAQLKRIFILVLFFFAFCFVSSLLFLRFDYQSGQFFFSFFVCLFVWWICSIFLLSFHTPYSVYTNVWMRCVSKSNLLIIIFIFATNHSKCYTFIWRNRNRRWIENNLS